jgi:tRNA nucleotidyltransferase/poly(A) polymerase
MTGSSDTISLTLAIQTALAVEKCRAERVFIVGGVVRDLVMGRAVGDFDLDLVVEGDGIAFARAMADALGGSVREHPAFLTAKVQGPFLSAPDRAGAGGLNEIDVATARTEQYVKPGALPTVSRATIEEDLWRRDFSINALAVPLAVYAALRDQPAGAPFDASAVLDPTQGRKDIAQSTVRVLHKGSFIDDPTRLFRSVRYTERLSFHFDMETLAAFVESVKSGALATLSPRRVLNEVLVALDEPSPSRVVEEFFERGLFYHLPIISEDNEDLVLAALRRLEINRGLVTPSEFRNAGRLIVLAGLLYDGREDVALATHEGGKIIARARRILAQERSDRASISLIEALGEFCLHSNVEARVLLEEAIQKEST